ncbi:N-acetylglucosamine-6-phosphate deacetylase [Mycobacterium shigaense]|uniref:N-acetylglucosamine-6-phosphate deacetylase n=1 Tax=Mycobacterium shigaense TaxID=722731 RepID=A0A1Z4EE52_9MYCO|nr:N-acetylglucosamine-6-phosphate deacetylase [Mycobacterium shigaense]MEA1121825.1 N-acetylglucosamine-6-phosphate deacetylase [Mycobacterium shigaense]PRI16071.1 N-acetylglucosamine-6-phosphate deacetylase [Mycobacterium shigaense]BAX91255.1 N-acetylglucosamine-6-phosphate deacetylase [Mycobacterium shigaense]
MALIAAGTAVLDGQVCRPGWLETSGERIVACGAGAPPGRIDSDFPEGVAVPGFVDMHVHGGGGASYTDSHVDAGQITAAADFHLRHGTTTTLASLVTAAPGPLLAGVRALADATRRGAIAGIHLEGPWLSRARCGAHDPTQLREPDPAEIEDLLVAGGGAIRMVTLAPEHPGSGEAIRRLRDAGVVVALGHTDATYDQTAAALALGASVGTHLCNAMPPLDHRAPGPVLALLEDPGVTVELIADGVHLHPAVAAAVVRIAGPHRVAAITDAIAAAGCADGPFQLGTVPVDVASGVARVRDTSTIAGSTATMDRLFRNLVKFGAVGFGADPEASLSAAVQLTSATPARALGLEGVGALRAGYTADVVVLDRDLRVSAVMTRGAWR